MDIIRVSVTIYFLQLNLLLVLGQSCYGERSRRGFVLLNTTFNSRITNSYPSCVDMCLHDPLCMSLNYWRDEKKCDLNNSTRETCRSCFVPEETSTYMGMGRFPGKKGSVSSVPGQSCRDIKDSGDFDLSGTYWIRPAGSRDSFQAYCDMSAVGHWKKVTQAWIENTLKGGVTLTYSEENNGLVISGHVTAYGCEPVEPGALTIIRGYWTKIKYTQEFRGTVSCWSIFGDEGNSWGRSSVNNQPTGVHSLNVSQGDSITNQFYMGGNSHVFDGETRKCKNTATNFWRNPHPSVRYATVVLRRNLTAEKTGIFTGTSCGTPTYKIKDVFVYF